MSLRVCDRPRLTYFATLQTLSLKQPGFIKCMEIENVRYMMTEIILQVSSWMVGWTRLGVQRYVVVITSFKLSPNLRKASFSLPRAADAGCPIVIGCSIYVNFNHWAEAIRK